MGTVEIFNKGEVKHIKNVGMLRLDLCVAYEKETYIAEIIEVAKQHFYEDFGLEFIMIKAIAEAVQRINVLKSSGYVPIEDYYIRHIMTVKGIAKNIGYCGLICTFCHESDCCKGCKSESNRCSKYLSEEGCHQYKCCTEKGLEGCWECETFSCNKDMFNTSHDIRNQVFVKCAREEGVERLCEYVLKNQLQGICYGWNKDYDNLGSEQAVLDLLHKEAY